MPILNATVLPPAVATGHNRKVGRGGALVLQLYLHYQPLRAVDLQSGSSRAKR